MRQRETESKVANSTCVTVRERLSRFVDNDLNGRDAARVADHLTGCPACQFEYEAIKRVQSAVHTLSGTALQPAELDAARDRVFTRLERAARTGEIWEKRAPHRSFPMTPRVWGPAAAMLAAAVVVGAFILNPADEQMATRQTMVGGVARVEIPLPSASEMSTFALLHDAHALPLTADEPVARRDATATARAALLENADAAVAGNL